MTELKHKFTILLTDHSNLDITNLVAETSIVGMENKISNAYLLIVNDVDAVSFIEQYVAQNDIIEIISQDDTLASPRMIYGTVVDKSPEITENGSFLKVSLYAFPAIGLNRMRVNEVYNKRANNDLDADGYTLREILVEPSANIKNDFPFYDEENDVAHEYYTEDHATGGTGYNFGDWFIHPYTLPETSTISDATAYSTFTPKVGSKFVLLYYDGDKTSMTFEFPRVDVDYKPRFPIFIDSWSNVRYDPVYSKWTKIPYLDFWMFTIESTGGTEHDIRLQLKVDDANYLTFKLTSQQNLSGYELNLLPNDGEWHHLIIPIGSKWGRGEIRVDPTSYDEVTGEYVGGNLVSDVGGTPRYAGERIIDRLGWNLENVSGTSDSNWNGIMSIAIQDLKGTGTASNRIGIDGLCIRNLGNPYSVIEDNVKKLFHLTESAYIDLDTNYIYNDTTTIIKYLKFCYEQATKAIMDTINIYGAMRYPSPSLHWIVTPYGKLCIAPIANHNVYGKSASYHIEDVWATNSIFTESNPITLGANIITSRFKQKEPEYNFILINGVYQYPQNNSWCSSLEIVTSSDPADKEQDKWFNTLNMTSGYQSDPIEMKHSGDSILGPYSLSVPVINRAAVVSEFTVFYLEFSDGNAIDVNLLGKPKISFYIKSANCNGIEMRIYTDDLNWSAVTDDYDANYFYHGGTSTVIGNNDGSWTKIEWELSNDGGWKVNDNGKYPTWSKKIKRIYFKVLGPVGVGANGYLYIDGLNISGNTLRAATSYNNVIANKGVKAGLINETLVSGYSLTVAERDNLDNLAIAECARCMMSPFTGSVEIELEPSIMAGQIAYISSPPFGASPKAFRILWYEHNVSEITGKAITTLYLTDDLINSYTRDPSNLETIAIKTISPDYQNRNFARLAVDGIDTETPLVKIINLDDLGT